MIYSKHAFEEEALPKYSYFHDAFSGIYQRLDRKYLNNINKPVFPSISERELDPKLPQRTDVFTCILLKGSCSSDEEEQYLQRENTDCIWIKESTEKTGYDPESRLLSTTNDSLFSDIDTALEGILMRRVLPTYHALKHDLNSSDMNGDKRDSKHSSKDSFLSEPESRNERSPKAHRDNLSRLVAEFEALFHLSKDPDIKKYSGDNKVDIPVKLYDALQNVCPSIKAVGYRFDTLEIHTSSLKEHTVAESKEKIAKVLSDFDIYRFEITECLENINELSLPGSTLNTEEFIGTFGCILKDEVNDKTYGAVSRHVVEKTDQQEVTITTEDNDICGKIVADTARYKPEGGSFDIAAIYFEQVINQGHALFRDSRNRMLPGELNRDLIYKGRNVYIWGDTSKPGHGIITGTRLMFRGEKQFLIKIENYLHDVMFAKEGDSGAIVCADDPSGRYVFALGMVMGCIDKAGKVYVAVPLFEGIEQLEGILKTNLQLM